MPKTNVLAKFLSQALEFKATPLGKAAKFYNGLRYDSFIYPWARRVFSSYNNLYPNDNEKFTQKFVKDLRNKDPQLLKTINPEVLNDEIVILTEQFDRKALVEQADVAASTPPQVETGTAAVTRQGGLRVPLSSLLSPPGISSLGISGEKKAAGVKTGTKITTLETGLDYEGKPYEVSEKQRVKLEGRRWQTPKIPSVISSASKNFVSNAGIFAKRNIFGKILTPGRLVTGFTTALGAIVGSSVGGVGALAGAAAGFSLPSFIKSGGGGRFFSRLGNGVINSGVGFSNQFSRLSIPNPKKRYLVGLLLGLFLLVAVGSILPLPKQESTEAAPLASPIPGTDINSCQFIRGDRNPPGETYKSPLLLSYFQEAESITTVPAIVLAAIARVESPSVTRKGDADIPFLSSLAGCPTSPTGALGIMQLQPPGTTGYFAPGIQLGASFIGKTTSQLTDRDFCDVRSSIIMAGGFILKKLELRFGIGDGSKWDPIWTNNRDAVYKVAEGFYGCLDYPSCISGPYNYGDDIWISIENCSPKQLASCPVPSGKITYPSYQADPINGHCTVGSVEYPCQAICPTTGRRAKSIDVTTIVTNGEVRLPTINNQSASWKFIQVLCAGGGVYPSCSTAKGATGALLTFEGTLSGTTDKWYLQFVHMEIPPLVELNKSYPSGTIIGQTDISIVHITIGKNIKFPYNSGSFTTDCDSGWMPADFMCK